MSAELDLPAAGPAASVELLLFDIGRSTFAADASQVRRIDVPRAGAIVRDELGRPDVGGRAIVFETADGEAQLRVDRVRGVQAVPLEELRRLPPVARGHRFALGLWLTTDRSVLLIDLPQTLPQTLPEIP